MRGSGDAVCFKGRVLVESRCYAAFSAAQGNVKHQQLGTRGTTASKSCGPYCRRGYVSEFQHDLVKIPEAKAPVDQE